MTNTEDQQQNRRILTQLDDVKERVVRIEAKNEFVDMRMAQQDQRIERLMTSLETHLDDERKLNREFTSEFHTLIGAVNTRVDSIIKELSQFKWMLFGISGTVALLWAIAEFGLNVLKLFNVS